MRCKKHGTDISSIVGVCATCLRERLFNLILAQEQQQQLHAQSLQHRNSNPNPNPNPPVRRSVSPYITHRKSVTNPVAVTQRPYNNPRLNHSLSNNNNNNNNKHVYNSPQIAINTGGCIGSSNSSSSSVTKFPLIRFPSISKLFRSNSRNGDGNGDADSNNRVSVSSAGTGVVRKQRCVRDRGMSPVRKSDEFSDESAESRKQTPMKTTARRGGGVKSVTDLIFCPLVSASPKRLLSLKGKTPVDCGFSGDSRTPVVPNIGYVKSFSGNRSRKLADFGRCDLNR